ncbi:hypothetical protein VPNG_10142 [Cytospora leucostoma]|uniref:Rhodopsin domain-containing protein n=1 Tax=Cytospora leucostoma TaxID=1230097 RepID=A0A423VFB5_9PEZI|nr:hypothetical protein VPNG_10142 [Cytospora leucostoma]
MSNIGQDDLHIDHALDGQSQVAWAVTIVGLACVISTIAVVLRIYTRLRVLPIFGPDDVVMGIAQLITIGAGLAIGLETKWGLGRHKWIMQDADYMPYMKAFYASIVTYNVGVCVVKISIMLQYRRIFAGDFVQKMTLALLIFECCYAVTLSLLLPLVCKPVSAFWDKDTPGTCLDQLTIWYVMASINLVTDFIVFSIPLPVINSLQLPRKQKYMLMGVFCLGFFTCIISVYRMQTLREAGRSSDPSWDNTAAAVWSHIELACGVLAASLPTLKPLLAQIFPRFFKSTTSAQTEQERYDRPATYGRNTGDMYGRSRATRTRTRTRNSTSGGGIFIKDIDGDLNALRTNGSRGSRESGDDGLELPTMYNVTVTGGTKGRSSEEVEHERKQAEAFHHITHSSAGGIQTTTIVTQRVDSL